MTNQSTMTNTMSVSETADHLAKSLGKTTPHWMGWLANDRKPNRVNRRLLVQAGPGRPRYDANVVDAFVREERMKSQSQGVSPGAPSERQFDPHISSIAALESGEVPFVFLATSSPLAVYKLTAAKARQIARRLTQAANEIEMAG